MAFRFSVLSLFLILAIACKSGKKTVQSIPEVTIEERELDTLFVTAPLPEKLKAVPNYTLPVYHPSYSLKSDLLHTKLELRFDWGKQHVMGKATLKLKPYFYAVDQLILDAKGFDLHKVQLADGRDVKYDYDGQQINILLDRTYQPGEEYSIAIDYTAKPAEGPEGGSAAITSDQGLFFINHDGTHPTKPMQIWTQGETEYNSRWFPTVDKPNERCTQEIYLTVQDRFKTLSNGLLVSSNNNGDGTRTDYWKMDQAHAPYLFMLAVGEFAIVEEEWNGIAVDYYVEPEFEKHARAIFNGTREMLTFFSDKLDYKYPWSKYAQVIVRDYVSGAMENTTGVIFGEFIQRTDRELIDDYTNELIIAHELFHHWFGDLVTCESWANLTMNEGFANYSEYLWMEHKYGKDRADHHRLDEMNGYLGSTKQGGIHPLIYFGYKNKEDMFDAHSYNKGGLVLHQLRNYVGDVAFWAGLNRYLKDNAYTAVEAHDLRLAFEEVTGEDLNWFFNQWYFSAGHPILDITYDYDAETGMATVNIEQTQDPEKQNPPIFQLPFSIDVYTQAKKPTRHKVMLDKRKQSFSFPVDSEPKLMLVDAEDVLLAEKNDQKSEEALIFQYYNAPNFIHRLEALRNLGGSPNPAVAQMYIDALDDPYWELRRIALSKVNNTDPNLLDKIKMLAINDIHSSVRASAVGMLGVSGDSQNVTVVKTAIERDQAYPVLSAALDALIGLDENVALDYAQRLESERDFNIVAAVGKVYASKPDDKYLPFFEKNLEDIDGFSAISFYESYSAILQQADLTTVREARESLKAMAGNPMVSPWKRFSSTKTMHELRENYRSLIEFATPEQQNQLQAEVEDITKIINEIKEQETNNQLKMIYNNF
ncbi:MAG: M1 family aminopeptidase [Bacteroidota bacterium]